MHAILYITVFRVFFKWVWNAVMASSRHWQLILIQILFTNLHLTIQNTDQYDKNADVEKITIPEGTHRYNLTCTGQNKPIWKKDGLEIHFPKNKYNLEFDLNGLASSHLFPLLCVKKSDEGSYTCHDEKNRLLKRINVTVSQSGKYYPCGGSSGDRLHIEVGSGCESPIYPCCELEHVPVAAGRMDVNLKMEKWLNDSNNKCDIVYSGPNSFTYPYNVIVDWELDDTGTSGTWGWQIDVLGLAGDAGYQYCVHINSRDKLLKWIIKRTRLTPGATYNITLQTLPKSNRKPNYKFKLIRLPNFPDMCETIGRNCSWEFCFPVENLTVTNHSSSPLVSWSPSPFYKFQHVFEVNYTDENGSDSDRYIVKNGSHFRLTNLKHKYSRKYFVEVRPIFAKGADSNRIYGKRSIKLMFYTAYPPTPTEKHDDPSNKLKIIIFVCVATVCLCIVFSLLVYLWYHRPTSDDEGSGTSEERLIPDQSKNVLLVHDGHCKSCNDATHSLANVFWETGHIKCSLDLCSTKEIAVAGMGWYEEQLKNCEKIVVVCTKESKKTYYENIYGQGSNTNMYKLAFRFVLKMILGQISSGNNNAIQVFPVCFDHSSNEDIPNFLRDRRYYSLPSDINPLLLSLSGLNARQIGDMAEYGFEDSNELQRRTSQWKNAIQKVEKSHGRAQAGSLINYARSLSSSSADDPCRV